MKAATSVPSLTQLGRSNLRAQARSVLRSSIVTGELQPGSLYTIGGVAAQLGVSATPVREALGDLEQLGLVEIIRNRGFIVPPVTDADLDEILQLRLMLEPPALIQAAKKLTPEDIRECRELAEQGKAAAKAGDLALFLEADRALHLRLIAPLHNRRLGEILGRLRDEARLYGLRNLATAGRLVTSAEEHDSIIEAVAGGDSDVIREEITKHLRHTRGAWAGLDEDSES
jgi:DNA-binding GntR family transcriptional regulator